MMLATTAASSLLFSTGFFFLQFFVNTAPDVLIHLRIEYIFWLYTLLISENSKKK